MPGTEPHFSAVRICSSHACGDRASIGGLCVLHAEKTDCLREILRLRALLSARGDAPAAGNLYRSAIDLVPSRVDVENQSMEPR